jgi:hypothetical protein
MFDDGSQRQRRDTVSATAGKLASCSSFGSVRGVQRIRLSRQSLTQALGAQAIPSQIAPAPRSIMRLIRLRTAENGETPEWYVPGARPGNSAAGIWRDPTIPHLFYSAADKPRAMKAGRRGKQERPQEQHAIASLLEIVPAAVQPDNRDADGFAPIWAYAVEQWRRMGYLAPEREMTLRPLPLHLAEKCMSMCASSRHERSPRRRKMATMKTTRATNPWMRRASDRSHLGQRHMCLFMVERARCEMTIAVLPSLARHGRGVGGTCLRASVVHLSTNQPFTLLSVVNCVCGPNRPTPWCGPQIIRDAARLLATERRPLEPLRYQDVDHRLRPHCRWRCSHWGQMRSKHAKWAAHQVAASTMNSGPIGQVGQESHLQPAVVEPAAVRSASFRNVHELP